MTGAMAARVGWAVLAVVLIGLSLAGLWFAGRLDERLAGWRARRRVPSSARHRKVTGPPASPTQVLPRIPVDVKPGRHVGRAKVRDTQTADRWPVNSGSDLERETRGIRYLPTNTVASFRWKRGRS